MSVTVFGSINMDVVMRVARLPLAGETVAASSLDHLPGGKGANQAVASARFGVATRMIGAVGDDAFGATMLAFLGDEAVAIDGVARHAGPTGIAHVFVSDEGENQIVIVAGANGLLAAPERWTGGGVALAQLETPLPAVATFLAQAQAAGALTMLNAAPALAEARPLLAAVDLLVVNETELAFFLAAEPPEDADAAGAAARRLARDADQWVVVTLGAKGIVAVHGRETLVVPAPRVAVVDTTGAGDTFCGVLAACLSEGMAMEPALRHACAAASLSVQRIGAAPSMPTRAEVVGAMAIP